MKAAVFQHRKTKRLAKKLGVPAVVAFGILAALWNEAARFHKDGDLSDLRPDEFADLLGLENGDAIIEALAAGRWIDPHPVNKGCYIVHDWFDHCEAWIIRDLIKSGRLPKYWERSKPLPEGFYAHTLRSSAEQCPSTAHGKGLGRDREGEVVYGGVGESNGTVPNAQAREESKQRPAMPVTVCTVPQAESLVALYPRRVGKRAAVKAVRAAAEHIARTPSHPGHFEPLAFLQARVLAYASSPAGRDPPPDSDDYRPHPATWFNQGRYDDDDSEWNKPNGNGHRGGGSGHRAAPGGQSPAAARRADQASRLAAPSTDELPILRR